MILMEAIGNLTSDPTTRTINRNGENITVCTFALAVNNSRDKDKPYFVRVTAWRKLAENCAKYLLKGRKVYVSGLPSASAYNNRDGNPTATLELSANDVEFLSPANSGNQQATQQQPVNQGNKGNRYQQVEVDELPY